MLPFLDNQDALRTQQYRDGRNLNARIALHDRFSTNKGSWHRWIFDHFNLPANARILEVGAGVGRLWAENAERIPPGEYRIRIDPDQAAKLNIRLAREVPVTATPEGGLVGKLAVHIIRGEPVPSK